MRYNWQHPEWPTFKYNMSPLQDLLYAYVKNAGLLSATFQNIDGELSQDARIEHMTEEALHTSHIEGENINPEEIRSSIRNQLQLNSPYVTVKDHRATGITALLLAAQQSFSDPLSAAMLGHWHTLLFQNEQRLFNPITNIGYWRTHSEPMQIIGGPIGKTTVFFEAPPAERVPEEMAHFISWFNHPETILLPGPIRAGIAHLYFESIHPFEDGNGRIGRAIAEKALSQELGYPCLFSLSKAINSTRKEYYDTLNTSSGNTLDITEWLTYFVRTVSQAQQSVEATVRFVIAKAKILEKLRRTLTPKTRKNHQTYVTVRRRGL